MKKTLICLVIMALIIITLGSVRTADATQTPFATVFAVVINGHTELCSVAAVNKVGQIIEIKCHD